MRTMQYYDEIVTNHPLSMMYAISNSRLRNCGSIFATWFPHRNSNRHMRPKTTRIESLESVSWCKLLRMYEIRLGGSCENQCLVGSRVSFPLRMTMFAFHLSRARRGVH